MRFSAYTLMSVRRPRMSRLKRLPDMASNPIRMGSSPAVTLPNASTNKISVSGRAMDPNRRIPALSPSAWARASPREMPTSSTV